MAVKVKKGTIKKKAHKNATTWVKYAINLMHEGYSTSYIREQVMINKDGVKTDASVDSIMGKANEKVVRSHFVESCEITTIHLKRYNDQINRLLKVEELPYPDAETLLENENAYYDWLLSRQKKISAYNFAIQTMYQKEKLLQYHNDGFTVVWNRNEEIEIKEKQVKPKADITKLNLNEQIELLHLIKKARKDDYDLIGVIQGTKQHETETIDVVAEVIETKPNIEAIKQLPIPVDPYVSPVTNFDPTIKLRESLKKLAAKKIEEAGGKLTDEEKRFLTDK